MSFEIRNQLMILLEDNKTAYGIANSFVSDNEQKLIVFERQFKRVIKNYQVSIDDAASIATDKSEQLWKEYEKPEPLNVA